MDSLSDSRASQLRALGDQLASSGEFTRASEIFRDAIQIEPGSAVLHEALAQILNELDGSDEEALNAASTAVHLAPKWPEAHVTLAHTLRNCGLLDDAAIELRSSLAMMTETSELRQEILLELQEIMELLECQVARMLGLPQLRVSQQPAADESTIGLGPSIKVWEAGMVLAGLLIASIEFSEQLQGASVLELGSGTGIVGLTAALLGARVTLSDLPDALPALHANLDRNKAAISEARGFACACALDWNNIKDDRIKALSPDMAIKAISPELNISHLDIILGADLVYAEAQAEPLVMMLAALAKMHPNATILLAHKHRNDETDLVMLRALAMVGFNAERERLLPDQAVSMEAANTASTISSVSPQCCEQRSHGPPKLRNKQDRFANLLTSFPFVSVYRLSLQKL